MAINEIFLGALNTRKLELESLKTAKAAEISELRQKIESSKVLANKMNNKTLHLDAVKSFDPEYVESEITVTDGLIKETKVKLLAMQAVLRQKQSELTLLEEEYAAIDNGHTSAGDETLQIEALENAVNAL